MAVQKRGAYGVVTLMIRGDDQVRIAKKALECPKVFKNEVSIMRELQDIPFVMPIFEVDAAGLSFTMPGFDGDMFSFIYSHLLDLDLRVRLRVIRGITRRLLTGLAQVHKRGVVHMDVKAKNVVLDVKDGRVTRVALADFGTAMRIGTQIKAPEGTLGYSPPEVLSASDTAPVAVDTSIDMYCFGVMLAMLLTGHVKKCDAVVCAVALGPPEFASLINALMDVDPTRRPTAEEALAYPFLMK